MSRQLQDLDISF